MVETIRVDDWTANYLMRIKGARSYSEVIKDLARQASAKGETTSKFVAEMNAKYGRRKKENVSERIDEILYGKKP